MERAPKRSCSGKSSGAIPDDLPFGRPLTFNELLKQFIQYWTNKEPVFIVCLFQQHYINCPGIAINVMFGCNNSHRCCRNLGKML